LTLAEATASMVVLHATDPAGLFLEARARLRESTPDSISSELYEDRTVLRLLAMRRTLFLAAIDDVPMVHAAASRAVGAVERRRTLAMLKAVDAAPDPQRLLEELEALVLEAIRERGSAATADLRALDPRLGIHLTIGQGTRFASQITFATKVVFHLALDGRIGRDRPRGTWISGQFRWSPIERWLPNGIDALDTHAAQADLARRWLRVFGPGTRADLAWWTGWTMAATRNALAAVGAVEVRLDGGDIGYVLPDDLDVTPDPGPWLRLLPALDATIMGWKDRAWYLGPHRAAVFDSAGNAGPTVWVNGRIVGRWIPRPDGEIEIQLLEPVDRETGRQVDVEAAQLRAWLGPTRLNWPFGRIWA
jgi:hypothetical protein